jgi:release factor glutamine methyltransferase
VTLDEAMQTLAAAGIDNPRMEARLLFAHALGISRDQTLTATATAEQAAKFETFVARRTAREPFGYISGRREFWSMDFEVGPGVLVPRPDTETLIEEALRLVPDCSASLKIADMGTGSGAILIAALKEFPNATGIGLESSQEAFNFASHNARMHMPDRAEIRLADWNTAQGPFDLVFSNPPYIPTADIDGLDPEVRLYEPHAALDGGADGFAAYRDLAGIIPRLLRPGGLAFLELGRGQAIQVEPLFGSLAVVHVAPDLAGIPRVLVLKAPK